MKNLFLLLIICGLIFSFVSWGNVQPFTPSKAIASDLMVVKSIDKRAIEGPTLRGDEVISPGQNNEEPSVLSKVFASPGDTVGGTAYDWWLNGPATRRICYNPSTGSIHLTWMHSRQCAASGWPDRHMFYNFWDGTEWAYNNPDFMESGVAVNPLRDGYGTIDIDYSTDIEVVCSHASEEGVYYSWVCYDIMPGGGYFVCNHCPTPIGICDDGIIWPRLALGPSGYVHVCASTYEDVNKLYYCKSTDGGNTFSPWVYMATMGFPTHSIAASQNSPKVCIVWSVSDGDDDGVVYYKESTDGGETWGDSVDITSDVPSDLRHAWILGGYPFYDSDDNLHIATQTSDGENIAPTEIWHWCEANSPKWSLVASYPELWELAGSPGYNALCQDRSSIGMDPTTGYLYCVWEEFPWDDAEPATGRANAEIYAARSMDNGVTWGNKVNLTNTFGETERYPSLAPVVNGTLHIEYLADLIAGQEVQSEGDCTDNPTLYLAVPVIEGDVAALSIDNPTDPPTPGDTCYPKATVSNLGSNEVTFQARLSAVIKGMEFYYDIKEVTLEGGASVQVEFDPWLVDSLVGDTVIFEGEPPDTVVLDTLIITCYASLLGDMDLSNGNVSVTYDYEGLQNIPTQGQLPRVFTLSQNYPNPFNPITSIEYAVPKPSEISLKVYNVLGQEVKTLVNLRQNAGKYRATWDGEDNHNQKVTSGIYFYQLKAGDVSLVRKMVLLK